MSEMGGSYDPGPWRGWDFDSARKAHTNLRPSAGRGYSGSSSSTPSVAPTNLVPDKVTTNAKSPLVVVVDGTGSMGQFPKIIFQKLPLLDDGVDDVRPDPGSKPEKYGPRFRSIMEMNGVTMEEVERRFCKKCKKEHKSVRRLCETCWVEHLSKEPRCSPQIQ